MPEITISSDGLQAVVDTVGPRTTAEEIIVALNEAGVTDGMQTSAIVGAIAEVKETGKPVSDLVVAQGTPPRFKVPPQIIHKPRGEEEDLPSLKDFNQLLGVERPGEVEPGKSVKGHEIDVIGNDQIPPQAVPGRGVDVADGTDFSAKFAGYAGILDGQVTVVSPVWISPDEMVAAYVHAQRVPGSAKYTKEEISSVLSAAGVKVGIVDDRLVALGKSLEEGTLKKVLVPVAAGKFPRRVLTE